MAGVGNKKNTQSTQAGFIVNVVVVVFLSFLPIILWKWVKITEIIMNV